MSSNIWQDKKYIKLRLSELLGFIPDRIFIKAQYRLKTGKSLDLKNPQTFNEKIQWIKLYDHNPLMKLCVDKYSVRDYVRDIIGDTYLIPIHGVYSTIDDVNFNKLPDEFIVKLTNGSSFNYIVTKKSDSTIALVKKLYRRWIKTNYYKYGREWAYRGIENRIIIESLLKPSESESLEDYRFFCFDGKVGFITTDRGTVTHGTESASDSIRRNVYDSNFNLTGSTIKYKADPSINLPDRNLLLEMKSLAEKLSKPFRHARVDMYCFDGKIYFGEITFYHAAGYQEFHPAKFALESGNYINLLNRGSVGDRSLT